jgi:hypothetical protein
MEQRATRGESQGTAFSRSGALRIASLVAAGAILLAAVPVTVSATPVIPPINGLHLWPNAQQLDARTPLPWNMALCFDLPLPAPVAPSIEACALFDSEDLYIRLRRSSPPPIAAISILPSPTSTADNGYTIMPAPEAAPRAWHDPRSWREKDQNAQVRDCSNRGNWCQLVFIPLSDLVMDKKHQVMTTFTLRTTALAPATGSGTPVSGTADFTTVPGEHYPAQSWARAGYGEHIGPPQIIVTPNPAPAGATPAPSPPPLIRRAEAQGHAYVTGDPNGALAHISLDAIVGQSALILAPDRATILNVVQPSASLKNTLSSILECPDCSEYRDQTSGALQRLPFGKLVNKKVDVSQLSVDNLLYDSTSSLGPFDSSFTLSRVEEIPVKFRYGLSQFHGTAPDGSFTFNDVAAHVGAELSRGNHEFDVYGTHVSVNHGTMRAVDAGAVVHYTNALGKFHVLAEYSAELASAQRRMLMVGYDKLKSKGGEPWSLSAFVGWNDSDAGFSPADGTPDSLYGTRGPVFVAHLERDGNVHGTGSVALDVFARRAFDAVAVRRSNVGVTLAYGISNLFSVTGSLTNRPSAGSVIFSEAGQPFMVPSPAPAGFTEFKDRQYTDSRTAVQVMYSNASVAADRFELGRGIVEASLGFANSRTACVQADQFSCAAQRPNRPGFTGAVSWLTRGREFVGINHEGISNPNAFDPRRSSSAITDGFVVGSALNRCGSAYFGSQTAFGNADPTKNGRTILGSIVYPVAVGSNGSASALRIEYKHRVPLVVAPKNVPENSVNVQLVVGTPHYYAASDVTRCRESGTAGSARTTAR